MEDKNHHFRTARNTLVFSWGRGDLGQLGLGDEKGRDSPSPVTAFSDTDVVHIAANDFHSAFITIDGELYTSGSNDYGQLGSHSRDIQLSPVLVLALDTHTICHVACGQGHTVAVTDTGALASWGAAEFGQLGHKDAAGCVDILQPRILRGSRELHFVQVACGGTHSLALTGSGAVFSFGQGTFGALGHGNIESCAVPTFIDDLWGLGIVQVACGENHSSALSVDGQVFTWGWGKYGQLGHGTTQNETRPVLVEALIDQMIALVVCGGDHMLALNNEGHLFSWGRGHWGQTGLGTLENVPVPKQVEFGESQCIIQVSAGSRHSIALTSEGKLFGWGDGEQGQLGKIESQVQPFPVVFPGLSEEGMKLLYVVAGGEHTFAVYKQQDQERLEPLNISEITEESFDAAENDSKKAMMSDEWHDEGSVVLKPLTTTVDSIYGRGLRALQIPNLINLLEGGAETAKGILQLGYGLDDIFSSVRFVILSFKLQPSFWQKKVDTKDDNGPGLDVEMIKLLYQRVLELYNPEIIKKLCGAMIRLFEGIEAHMDSVPVSRWTRVLLVGLQSPFIGGEGFGDLLSIKLFAVFIHLSPSTKETVTQWLGTYPREIFGGRFVRGVLKFISHRKDSLSKGGIPHDIHAALVVLNLLFEANKIGNLVSYTEFYSKTISENAELEEDYLRWVPSYQEKDTKSSVSYCQFAFVLNPQAKSRILQVEAFIQKRHLVQSSVFQQMLGNYLASPFFVLVVQRSNLVQDSLQQLMQADRIDLRKPLKVVFEGEEGVDEGGVAKEFFQLLFRDLFNIDYGMFTYDEETRNFWFDQNSMESEQEFRLVGIILGLGIYNGIILDARFPLVVYKKLLGIKPCVEDMKDWRPEVARSMNQLLEYDGDVDDLCLVFQVTYDFFGEKRSYDLLPNGGNIPVTNENRERYVDLYVQYTFNESIKRQYSAFENGFKQVCEGRALHLFNYEELELLICGLPHFDFDALEKVSIYTGGFTKDSQEIKWFWEVVREMTLEEKKRLLSFATGNDRSPIGGLGTLKFIIQRNGDETDRLPTAHTCFNLLLLPEYASKAKLENRLKLAISNATGFGLQ